MKKDVSTPGDEFNPFITPLFKGVMASDGYEIGMKTLAEVIEAGVSVEDNKGCVGGIRAFQISTKGRLVVVFAIGKVSETLTQPEINMRCEGFSKLTHGAMNELFVHPPSPIWRPSSESRKG